MSERISCAICTKHPHDPADNCTPFCIEVPQPKGKTKVLHRHLPDADCISECRSRDADLGIICTHCAQRIRTDLDTLVDAWALTDTPPDPKQGGDGRGAERNLPGTTEWIDWRHGGEMFGVLTSWVRDWCETYALAGPKYADLTSLTGWLRAHLDHAANSHPAIDDFADEIRKHAKRGLRISEQDVDKTQRVRCPADDCGRWLRINANIPEAEVRCKGCDTTWSSARLIVVGVTGDTPVWLDPDAAAVACGKSTSTLRLWAQQGKIQRDHGRYELHSIRAAMTA